MILLAQCVMTHIAQPSQTKYTGYWYSQVAPWHFYVDFHEKGRKKEIKAQQNTHG